MYGPCVSNPSQNINKFTRPDVYVDFRSHFRQLDHLICLDCLEMTDSRQAMRTFLRCMKLQTADSVKNARKERILAYYNYAGDTVKSAMYMGYRDATDRSDWT